jgi:hypothetical protein
MRMIVVIDAIGGDPAAILPVVARKRGGGLHIELIQD